MANKKSKQSGEEVSKLKNNPWIIASIVLAVLCVVLVSLNYGSANCATGKVISKDEASSKLTGYLNSQVPQGEVSVDSVEEDGSLYEVTVNYQGRQMPVYMTKDGSKFVPQVSEISEQQTTQNQDQQTQSADIPKSESPKAQLFIFSYCPAGSSALDSFAKVADLLKNKAKLEVNFFSHMHGEHEKQQNKIQACIQEVAPSKYWKYAKDYVETVYSACARSRDKQCDKSKSLQLMEEVGIDSDKVMGCVRNRGEKLYQEDKAVVSEYGFSSSPSLAVNDVALGPDYQRSPKGVKNLICSAFKDRPSVCSKTLSSSSTTTSGSC